MLLCFITKPKLVECRYPWQRCRIWYDATNYVKVASHWSEQSIAQTFPFQNDISSRRSPHQWNSKLSSVDSHLLDWPYDAYWEKALENITKGQETQLMTRNHLNWVSSFCPGGRQWWSLRVVVQSDLAMACGSVVSLIVQLKPLKPFKRSDLTSPEWLSKWRRWIKSQKGRMFIQKVKIVFLG